MKNTWTIYRRTFAAKRAETKEKQAELNSDALTSQYFTSQPYLVRVPINTPQKYIDYTFKTKGEAQKFINEKKTNRLI